MAIRINKISIESFKIFKTFSEEFNSANVIIFDGPNGFGKTSFFDAIELLLTGKIRRYRELEKDVLVSARERGSYFLNKQGGDLIIKAELEVDGENIVIMRKGLRHNLISAKNVDEFISYLKLYELDKYEDREGKIINNEQAFMTKIMGEYYRDNFHFLNYVEQEENTYLLKNKEKTRQENIAYLFNTDEYENRQSKIETLYNALRKMCGKEKKDELDALEKEISDNTNEIVDTRHKPLYFKLLEWKNCIWDNENVDFKTGQYSEWIGEDGLLDRIKNLVINAEEYKKMQINNRIDKILNKDNQLKLIVLYYKHLNDYEKYKNIYIIQQSIIEYISKCNKDIKSTVIEEKAELGILSEMVSKIVDIKTYYNVQTKIRELYNQMDALSKVEALLKDSRDAFISHFYKLQNIYEDQKECPLCGYEWESAKQLKLKLEEKSKLLAQITNKSQTKFNTALKNYENEFIIPIIKYFNAYLENNNIDKKFIDGLKEAKRQENELHEIYTELESIGVQINKAMCEKTEQLDEKYYLLVKEIENKKYSINGKNIYSYYSDYFVEYFNSKWDKIKMITVDNIEEKRKYLKWQYMIYQSVTMKDKKEQYEKKLNDYKTSSQITDKLKDLKDVYKTSLFKYRVDLIKNVEILFHVYSGRIAQDYQGGLGLFIATDNGIRFCESSVKSQHDAVFSMSAGQLAVLIIAFTMTLNKRYSEKYKVLFIDDPVQTLDEINMAGLIEILRNEFSDRQIFMSTHEDEMSSYIRYKFEKYGLETKRVNFREQC